MNIFSKQLATLKAALEGIGFEVGSISPETQEKLKAYVDEQQTNAVAEVQGQLDEARSDLASAKDLLTASAAANDQHAARIETIVTALSECGIKLDAKADAETISKAVSDRISVKAGEQLAEQGQVDLVDDQPNADTTKAEPHKNLTGSARSIAFWNKD